MDALDDFNDWLEELEGTHKILLGVGIFFASRWLYDSFRDAQANRLNLPQSDSQTSRHHFPLSQSAAKGIYQTLDVMAQLVRRDAASPYLRKFALDLVRDCNGHDVECETKRLFQFVRDNVTFRRDPAGIEQVSDARRTLESGVGDCDDKSVLLGSLLAVIGHKSRFVICGFKPHSFDHVYLEIHTPRGWIALDPTPENAAYGWEQKHAPYKERYEVFR